MKTANVMLTTLTRSRTMLTACALVLSLIHGISLAATLKLDESPAREGYQWGYSPASGAVSETSPPSFCWRPQKGVVCWELECGRGEDVEAIEYRAAGITLNVHCPPRTFPPGTYTWRYRGTDKGGNKTNWSRPRTFSICNGAVAMPMPPREELLGRIPKSHPRLFVRPEEISHLRKLAKGPLNDRFEVLVARCEQLLADPPPTVEPPKYPLNVVYHSEDWCKIWWGNRKYTIATLDGAATLGFTRLLGGKEEYGQLARRILLECAKWDPKGATGYRYNDEAGMPYNYYFSRTYTFVHDLLTEEERDVCRRVMKVRGQEMYRYLCPRQLWRPYGSHENRAWHFLGEVGIAFLDEIEEADDWVWFATNVFYNVYPVWSDDDGGWHEGSVFWCSYISRFTWWADVMHSAMSIDACRKPYFSKAGYYAMYLMPPGKVGGGFGDFTARRNAVDNVPLMAFLAARAGNGHWQWYIEQAGGLNKAFGSHTKLIHGAIPATLPNAPSEGYVGFVRASLPKVAPKPPDDLPTSRLFRGTGQACLNTTLRDANEDVQVVFKSSPFGSQSHGYEANNSFLLWAYGQRLLIRSGCRDMHGSEHHNRWMWSTRSVNNITVNGRGQIPHSPSAKGRIVAFKTTPSIDVVIGEAGEAHPALNRFTRAILFVKPELVIVFDRLVAREDSTFQYWLHAINKFAVKNQRDIQLKVEDVNCAVSLLAPDGLEFTQTNQYDPNPWPRVKLREWHLTAATPSKAKTVEFVALFRPRRAVDKVPRTANLQRIDGGYVLTAELSDGRVVALLPTDDSTTLAAEGLKTTGEILVQRRRPDGSVAETLNVGKQE